MGVGLPNLYSGTLNRLPLQVQDASHDMNDLSLCASRLASDGRQIRVLIQRFEHRIKRPQVLTRRPF
jgi:hypothetical protein